MDDGSEGVRKRRTQSSANVYLFPDNKMAKLERESKIRTREERLKSILSPIEGLIMNIESLLVWEKTRPSAVLFVCVNIVFWLAVTTNQRVVFIATMICFLVVCVETFRNRVWPDMQVNPRDPTEEEWTPLHARLLSVPELSGHLASAWTVADDWYNAFWELRKREPAKFCTYMCCLCLFLATIGYYIPGVVMSYFILVSLLLWPAFLYHDIYGKLYAKVQPYMWQFEQSIDSLERREKRQRRRRRSSRSPDGVSSSDSDLDEFCPTPGPAVDAALSHAATVVGGGGPTPSSSCGGTPTYSLMAGIFPRGASVEFTDDELNATDNEANNLLAGMSQMPSFTDRTLDPSGDELDSTSAGRLLDPTRLRPPTDLSGISTDEDIGDHILDTPETPLNEVLGFSADRSVDRPTSNPSADSSIGFSQDLPPAAAQLLSQTVAAVMSEAVASLANLRSVPETDEPNIASGTSTESPAVGPGPPIERPNVGRSLSVEKPKQEHPTLPIKPVVMGGPTASDFVPSGLTPSPQSDEELAEFEMLDSSELESAGHPTPDEERPPPMKEGSPGAINAGINYLSSFFTRKT